MRLAYYARPMSIYKTPQEDRDKQLIKQLGFDVVEINTSEIQAQAKEHGMLVFKDLVRGTEALFFRAFFDGSIGAGVAQEIALAAEINLPIVELPSKIKRRTLNVEDTKAALAELGQR